MSCFLRTTKENPHTSCLETHGFSLAPQIGLEPITLRFNRFGELRAELSFYLFHMNKQEKVRFVQGFVKERNIFSWVQP